MTLDLWWRSRGKISAPLGAAAAVWYLLYNQSWAGEWQDGVQAATNALVFGMALLTLAAGADGRAYTRASPMPWPASPWRAATRLARLMFLTWTWSALAVATVLATSLAVNASLTPFDYPGTLPLLLPFAWTAAYTCWGYLLGRLLPVPLMVLGVACSAYLAPLLLSATPDVRPALYTFVDDGVASPPLFLDNRTLAAQLGLVVAMGMAAALAVLLSVRRFGPRASIPLGALIVGAVLLCAGLTTFGPYHRTYEASDTAGRRVCHASLDSSVCVWSDHIRLLGPALRAAGAITQAYLKADLTPPAGFAEAGLSRPPDWAAFSTGTSTAAEADLARSLTESVISATFCGHERLKPDSGDLLRADWLMSRTRYVPPDEVSGKLKRLLGRPVSAQVAWFLSAKEGARCI